MEDSLHQLGGGDAVARDRVPKAQVERVSHVRRQPVAAMEHTAQAEEQASEGLHRLDSSLHEQLERLRAHQRSGKKVETILRLGLSQSDA